MGFLPQPRSNALMSTQHGLFLLPHQDRAAWPDCTEGALRVFFPLQADDYLGALERGERVLVRRGERDALGELACNLSAQGLKSEVRTLDAAA